MPTVSVFVAAGADDGNYSVISASYTPGNAYMVLGYQSSGWMRFTGFSGLSGQTINHAYLYLWDKYGTSGGPLTTIYADKQAAPTAVSGYTDGGARTRTTAGVNWDNPTLSTSAYTASPDIKSIIQELVNAYDPSAIQLLIDDRSSPSFATYQPAAFENGTPPRLVINYGVDAVIGPLQHVMRNTRQVSRRLT